jgi:hypothetical protein
MVLMPSLAAGIQVSGSIASFQNAASFHVCSKYLNFIVKSMTTEA